MVTSLLFTIGKLVIGPYLGHSGTASTYGAAGSLVVLLLWIYYSAQILFFGAEFTQLYANRYGRQIKPAADATALIDQTPPKDYRPDPERTSSSRDNTDGKALARPVAGADRWPEARLDGSCERAAPPLPSGRQSRRYRDSYPLGDQWMTPTNVVSSP